MLQQSGTPCALHLQCRSFSALYMLDGITYSYIAATTYQQDCIWASPRLRCEGVPRTCAPHAPPKPYTVDPSRLSSPHSSKFRITGAQGFPLQEQGRMTPYLIINSTKDQHCEGSDIYRGEVPVCKYTITHIHHRLLWCLRLKKGHPSVFKMIASLTGSSMRYTVPETAAG